MGTYVAGGEGRGLLTSEESKAIVLRWFAELDRGNLDIVEDLIAEDYVDHNPALPNLPAGREGVRQYVRILKSAFPDAAHVIDDIIAEGDKVMTRVTAHGTFLGECIGYQPTAGRSRSAGSRCIASRMVD